jgi:hypothetical protein
VLRPVVHEHHQPVQADGEKTERRDVGNHVRAINESEIESEGLTCFLSKSFFYAATPPSTRNARFVCLMANCGFRLLDTAPNALSIESPFRFQPWDDQSASAGQRFYNDGISGRFSPPRIGTF